MFSNSSNTLNSYDPRGIAVDSSSNLIYVVNKGSDDVSVVDGLENSVINTINLARLPYDIDVSPETNRIYVTNTSSNDVSVINSLTNEVITNVPVGITPQGLAVNPNNNQIYITNENSHTVSVIEGVSNEVFKTIDVGCNPVDVTVDHETNMVYVAVAAKFGGNRICDNSPSVTVIDGLNNNILTTTNTLSNIGFSRPISIGNNSETNRIYVSDENNNSVNVIDGGINEIINNIELNEKPGKIDVNPLLNRVYVVTGESITVIDGVADNVIDKIKIGSSLSGLKVNPNKNHIYVNDADNGVLIFIDGFTHEIIRVVEVGGNPQGIGVDLVNNIIYVANHNSGTVMKILDETDKLSMPTASPTPTLTQTPTATPTPTLTPLQLIPHKIIANPNSAKSSLRFNDAIIKILDQLDQPMSNIIVEALAKGRGSIVLPASATTNSDGIVKFKFRFGFIEKNGEIIFNVDGLTGTITHD